MTTHDTPDETPRATLREDERAVAEVLAAHRYWHRPAFGDAECTCGWRGPFTLASNGVTAHVAEQIAPLVAAARAEERERVAVAIEAEMDDVSVMAMLDAGARDGFRLAARIARGDRRARTAPSTDQATTPPGVTGGSGEG
jgi:hypothetical protein